AEALQAYQQNGRIHHDADPERARDYMVDRWWATTSDGSDALMLAAHHDAVRDLNERARQRMEAAGMLGDQRVRLSGREYAVGDEVLGLKNEYRIGLLNGTRGATTEIDANRHQIHVRVSDDVVLRVPFAYAEAGHLAHGYAMTIHKAQGATCDHAFVLVDETMTREAVYTGMSRGRQGNDLYLAVDTGRAEIAHAPEIAPDPVGALLAGIERSTAQEMAIEIGGRGL
ncbi:MAG: ATP-binding domain-containing protein, partial [Coriobacteriales bacterium]|nr:ATP-binding domain-containing protein [Coriobacteriales bacterium]